MLRDHLYKILSLKDLDQSIHCEIQINEKSPIFEGHFPGKPILPGCCMMELTKEILGESLGTPLQLIKADRLKFLKILDPGLENRLTLILSYKWSDKNEVMATANLISGKSVYFKMIALFIRT